MRTSLPIELHTIPGHSTAVVEADFESKSLAGGTRYELIVEGTYRAQRENKKPGPLEHFKLHTPVLMPPASPGSHTLGTTPGIPSNKTNGAPYPHQAPQMDNETNSGAPVVPTTKFVPGTPTPTGTQPQKAPIGDPPAINFEVNNPVGISGAGQGCNGDSLAPCAGPSGGGRRDKAYAGAALRSSEVTSRHHQIS